MAEDKIRALFIFEILGRPPEHIKKALERFVDSLEQKGIGIVSKKIHEPKPLEEEEAKNLFTSFAEVELVVDNLNLLLGIILNKLPASVEIIEPQKLVFNNFDLTSVLSELAVKLHKYDEVAKAIMVERNNLVTKINEMQEKINELNKKKTKKKK